MKSRGWTERIFRFYYDYNILREIIFLCLITTKCKGQRGWPSYYIHNIIFLNYKTNLK